MPVACSVVFIVKCAAGPVEEHHHVSNTCQTEIRISGWGPTCTCEDDPTDAALSVELQQGLGVWDRQRLQLLLGAVHCHEQVRHGLVVSHVRDGELAGNCLQQHDSDTFMLMPAGQLCECCSGTCRWSG